MNFADKELMRALTRFLPKKLRHSYYRKSATHAFNRAGDVIFKIATTQAEFEAAFRLTYKAYLDKNFILPHSTQMKFGKIHALPTTKVLIAVQNQKTVAALTLSLEGSIRTPCEEHFDLNNLRSQNRKFIEIGGLVVDPDSDEDFRSFLFPLCKLALEINQIFFKADYLVTAVPSEQFDYWNSVFPLEKFTERSVRLADLRNKNVVCAFADFAALEKNFVRFYGRKSKANNLYNYLFVEQDKRLQTLKASEIAAQKFSPQTLDYFFNSSSHIFASLTSFETRTLQKIYDEPAYQNIIPQMGARAKFENQRNVKRHHVNLTATLSRDQVEVFDLKIKTISLGGIGGVCEQSLHTDFTYELKVDVGLSEEIHLLIQPVWSSRDHTYGFKIKGQNPKWASFIESFHPVSKAAS